MPNKLEPHPDLPIDLPTAERIHAAVAHYGEQVVIDNSVALLRAKNAGKDFLLYAGGRHALGILEGAPALYWPELWGARALLYVWGETAAPYVVVGMNNQAWRVREMCAKVVLLRGLAVAPKLVRLTTDEVPRVRAAALHALAAQGTADHLATIVQRLRDPDKEVRRAAQQARDVLNERCNLTVEQGQGIEQTHGTRHTHPSE
ncbi:HEAT repeat domain-containing protein [Cryobacterium sinapicolor]|uniref:HEAT repeat domain-containing protein n=1 Tax=Cryobacterium sinapicolor TaxID=1259236 RepID=A0ABY2IVM2_9MICO|nr:MULTISPECIES: HEAT repeat domain-containing protein [Cryobacterium]TFC92159.1 HEAT repeat domain-containing protein [Cryobacterium sp. TMT3-29-2]TFC95661.1 HEAT repeat domain-containing protein [Cryobacterium sinapicolor]